ncbi:MAG: hypothetical protein LBB74_08770 [Chitinispirillales bacterium]|jgi:hypothetical protein|nr:hypothetical protein [Chitinispirillales bacterium]
MGTGAAGERVFDDVDAALAERIISRSMENSGEPERRYDTGTGPVDTDKAKRRPVSIIKAAIPVALVLIALWILIRRGTR